VLRFLVRYPLSRRNYTPDYAAHSVSKVAICSKALAIRMKYDTVRLRYSILRLLLSEIHYFSFYWKYLQRYCCEKILLHHSTNEINHLWKFNLYIKEGIHFYDIRACVYVNVYIILKRNSYREHYIINIYNKYI